MCCARWKPETARMSPKFQNRPRGKMAWNFMPMELGRIERLSGKIGGSLFFRRRLIFKCLPLTPTLYMNLDFNGTHPVLGVQATFIVSGNDRPHPNLLPRGEGTAIAGVSLRGCPVGRIQSRVLGGSGGSRREFFQNLSLFGRERESASDTTIHLRNFCNFASIFKHR